jgi:multisubunit Na+/H+ antiporter MnhB subunit
VRRLLPRLAAIARAGRLSSLEDLAAALAKRSLAAASWASRAVQAGGSSRHLALVGLAAASAAVGLALAVAGAGRPALFPGGDRPLAWIPSLLIFAGAGGALLLRDRASKAVTLGMAGFGVAVFYALFRAPDLVLTQGSSSRSRWCYLLLAFRMLPPWRPEPGPAAAKVRRAVVGVTSAAWRRRWSGSLGRARGRARGEAAAGAVPARGPRHNAFNVILVDFPRRRHSGEITVLVFAALGALVLLGRSGGAERGRG